MKWTTRNERGNEFSLRLIAWLARVAGRPFCRLLLYPIVLYFMATDKAARKASADFLQRVWGRKPKASEVFRHLRCFATTLLDRVYLANHEVDRFNITIENRQLIDAALAKGHGCVLLGSHLGSFDLMALARQGLDDRPLNIMMRIDPGSRLRQIAGLDNMGPKVIPYGQPHSLLLAHQALADGEIVAILADRVDGRSAIPVRFLGHHTRMPKGPYLLAARSNAPVLTCFGVYEGGNRYRITFDDPGILLDASSNIREISAAAQIYTSALETQAQRYPYNWFNFYPYWDDDQEEP